MQVQFGNPKPHQCHDIGGVHLHDVLDTPGGAPAVTYVHIPDGDHVDGSALYGVQPVDSFDLRDVGLHLAQNPDITRLPGHEAFLSIANPTNGLWRHHGAQNPTWVWSDHPDLAAMLGAFYGCPVLTADDLPGIEDTHQTQFGAPGVGPGGATDLQANITQNGRDINARALGGGQVGEANTATGSSSSTLSRSGASWTVNQWAGCRVVATTGGSPTAVWGTVVSNTSTALTVDQWYNPATPGGAASTTPSSTAVYMIMDGNQPAWFMGLSASTTALASPSTNTSLPSEIVTASGGLIRKICPYAHTASAQTYTLTPVFTANGSDSLPVTIGSIGVFVSMVVADTTSTMLFNTLLTATATLSASGDQLTVTETVTMT